MKTATYQLKVHMAPETTTLCRLLKIMRLDGSIGRYTDFDCDITYAENPAALGTLSTYRTADGLTLSAIEYKDDGSPNNCTTTGFFEDAGINEHDVRARLYAGATFELRVVNWADLTQREIKSLSGTIGDITMDNGAYTIELRGLTQKLTTIIGSLYGPVCRAEL